MFLNDKKKFYFLKNEVAHIVGPVKKNTSLNIKQYIFTDYFLLSQKRIALRLYSSNGSINIEQYIIAEIVEKNFSIVYSSRAQPIF